MAEKRIAAEVRANGDPLRTPSALSRPAGRHDARCPATFCFAHPEFVMRPLPRLVTTVAVTLGLSLLAAASLRPTAAVRPLPPGGLPVLVIQEVEAESAKVYAARIGEINKIVQAKWQIENHRHVFVGESAGDDTGAVFAVARGESFAALHAIESSFEKDADLLEARLHLTAIRKLGNQVSYQAVRFDGVHPDCAVLNTKAVIADEASYLSALDGLRTLFDAHGLKDVKVNCYRVAAGRTEWTHLISLNCPSRERRAALMDALNETWAREWITGIDKLRKVIANGTYRDITPTTTAR